MATAHWIGRQRKNHALAASRILKSIPFPRILQPVSRRTHLRSSAMNSPGATLTTAEGQPRTISGSVKDFTAWNLGALLTYGDFALGGGYVDAGDFKVPTTGAIDNDQSVWHAGLSYTTGPVAVIATYMDAKGYSSAYGDPTYSTSYKAYGLGATYALAPGLLLETDLMYFEDDFLTGPRGTTPKSN